MTLSGLLSRGLGLALVLAAACQGPDRAHEQQALALLPIGGIGGGPLCPISCDDKNPCTFDSCVDGLCDHSPNDNATCTDTDPCTYNERCLKGQCVVDTVACRSDVCTTQACDGRGGCTKTPKTGAACNDGNPCTNGDSCDGNGTCRPGTLVACQDDACNTRTCDGMGGCKATPKVGSSCTDGDACTYGDTCDQAGVCHGAGTVACVNDACNLRTCNGTATCKITPRTGKQCDDGEACSYNDVCNSDGACAGTPLVCKSDATAERACNGGPTCTVKPKPGVACDDNDPCTQGDVRLTDGTCKGMPYSCPIGACLLSSVCDGKGGCTSVSKPDDTGCDADQSQCTPHDVCRGGVCTPDPHPVKCVERDCNTVACNPTSGNCEYQPTSGGACGVSGCFSTGTCREGVCSGTPKDCSKFAGPCNEGLCDAATGACVGAAKPNGTDCSPKGACTAAAVCAFGVCELPPSACPTPTAACKVAACEPGSGACIEVARPAGAPCDPKNSCISDAVCDVAGVCIGTPAANGEPCTATSGQIGQCVLGACVASGMTPVTPPGGPDAAAIDAPAGGETPVTPAAPMKSGCAIAGRSGGGAGAGSGAVWMFALLGLVAGLARRRR